MYRKYYNLRRKPFQLAPDPSFLLMTAQHREALGCLRYGLEEGTGFIALTGEIGTGKTLLVRHVLNMLGPDMKAALILSTNISSINLLNLILQQFDHAADYKDKSKALNVLYNILIAMHANGKKALLIIDEAQNLSDRVLEEVRMLSNLQIDDHMLLQILLIGQPELRDKLKKPKLYQLAQRIAMSYHLQPLSREDVEVYIKHRLEKAGGRADIFSGDAMDIIHFATGGVPRSINLLCDLTLVCGFAVEIQTIGADTIREVLREKGNIGLKNPELTGFPVCGGGQKEVAGEVLKGGRTESAPEEKSAVPSQAQIAVEETIVTPPAADLKASADKGHERKTEKTAVLLAYTNETLATEFLRETAQVFGLKQNAAKISAGDSLKLEMGGRSFFIDTVKGAKKFFLSWETMLSTADAAIFLCASLQDGEHAAFLGKRLKGVKNAPCIMLIRDREIPLKGAVYARCGEELRQFFLCLPGKTHEIPVACTQSAP